eukprot:1550669-Rhodomonas_salina.1
MEPAPLLAKAPTLPPPRQPSSDASQPEALTRTRKVLSPSQAARGRVAPVFDCQVQNATLNLNCGT